MTICVAVFVAGSRPSHIEARLIRLSARDRTNNLAAGLSASHDTPADLPRFLSAPRRSPRRRGAQVSAICRPTANLAPYALRVSPSGRAPSFPFIVTGKDEVYKYRDVHARLRPM